MIKLQTDFHLSTIIEKRGRCPGGRANILGGGFILLSVVVASNLLESLSLQHPNLQHVFSMGTFLITTKGKPYSHM